MKKTAALPCCLAAALLAGAACTTPAGPARGAQTREYLDERTAATVAVATESLVFARERTDLAVNARDYLSLAAFEVNRGGKRAYYWHGHLWSTIDRRDGAAAIAPAASLVLLADGRPIRLERAAATLREVGVGSPPSSVPLRSATQVVFAADPQTLAFVGAASELSVLLLDAGSSESMTLWRDARPALVAFVRERGLERQ